MKLLCTPLDIINYGTQERSQNLKEVRQNFMKVVNVDDVTLTFLPNDAIQEN